MLRFYKNCSTAVLQYFGPHAELLWVCDQLSQLSLGQAVTVGVTLGSALRAGAVQASPPLPEERQTARAGLRLRRHVLPQVRAGRVVWSKYIKLLGRQRLVNSWGHLGPPGILTLNTSFSMISSCQGMETAPVLNLL